MSCIPSAVLDVGLGPDASPLSGHNVEMERGVSRVHAGAIRFAPTLATAATPPLPCAMLCDCGLHLR